MDNGRGKVFYHNVGSACRTLTKTLKGLEETVLNRAQKTEEPLLLIAATSTTTKIARTCFCSFSRRVDGKWYVLDLAMPPQVLCVSIPCPPISILADGELRAPFGCVRPGEVDDRQIGVVHCVRSRLECQYYSNESASRSRSECNTEEHSRSSLVAEAGT